MASVAEVMADDASAVCLAHVPLGPDCSHLSWGVGNELRLGSTGLGGGGAQSVKWGVLDAQQRRVAHRTASSFEVYQENRRNGEAEAALSEYATEVGGVLASGGDLLELKQLEEATRRSMGLNRAVWELIQLFFLERDAAKGAVTEELVSWYHRNRLAVDREADGRSTNLRTSQLYREMQDSPNVSAEHCPSFWLSVHASAALGWTETVWDLLQLHGAWKGWSAREERVQAQINLIESTGVLLQHFPRITGDTTQHVFMQMRDRWLEQVQKLIGNEELWARCRAHDDRTAAGMQQLLGILRGNKEMLEDATQNWIEYSIALLRHWHPLLDIGEVHHVTSHALERKQCYLAGGAEPGALDELVLAALRPDISAVGETQSASSRHLDAWFMAHVFPLLGAGGSEPESVLARQLPHRDGMNNAEMYMLEYASSLATNASTQRLAASYLAHCPVAGAQALEALALHAPAHAGEVEARAMLAVCNRFNLAPDTAARVCKATATSSLRRGLPASAAEWMKRSGDDPRLQTLAERSVAGPAQTLRSRCEEPSLAWLVRTISGESPSSAAEAAAKARFELVQHTLATEAAGTRGAFDEAQARGAAAMEALERGAAAQPSSARPLMHDSLHLLELRGPNPSGAAPALLRALERDNSDADAGPDAAQADAVRLALVRLYARKCVADATAEAN
mmetsp:Transcript_158/g.478  ORF Transcript_158/g.478 Transcript_158/m.478 type:complete len:682 (-) Transcript_158:55-2100(-)